MKALTEGGHMVAGVQFRNVSWDEMRFGEYALLALYIKSSSGLHEGDSAATSFLVGD